MRDRQVITRVEQHRPPLPRCVPARISSAAEIAPTVMFPPVDVAEIAPLPQRSLRRCPRCRWQ
jgi:hypothetical protein